MVAVDVNDQFLEVIEELDSHIKWGIIPSTLAKGSAARTIMSC